METDNRKPVVMDSSSAIILYKSGLFNLVAERYRISVPESVYDELTIADHAGSEEFRKYLINGGILVATVKPRRHSATGENPLLEKLDAGERDTILLYYCGCGSFVIIDDGKGAAFCRDNDIPYVNALLVPRLLKMAGYCSEQEIEGFMDTIVGYGRYSRAIIDYARGCDDDALQVFI